MRAIRRGLPPEAISARLRYAVIVLHQKGDRRRLADYCGPSGVAFVSESV